MRWFCLAGLLFASEASALCYPANVDRVIDGDTFVATVNIGFNIRLVDERIRPVGFDAPEPYQSGGPEATAAARELLPVGKAIEVCGDRRDVFGRILADNVLVNGEDFSELMTQQGHSLDVR